MKGHGGRPSTTCSSTSSEIFGLGRTAPASPPPSGCSAVLAPTTATRASPADGSRASAPEGVKKSIGLHVPEVLAYMDLNGAAETSSSAASTGPVARGSATKAATRCARGGRPASSRRDDGRGCPAASARLRSGPRPPPARDRLPRRAHGRCRPARGAEFWSPIRKVARAASPVFVTTHYMDEAEYCARIGLMMVAGKLVAPRHPAPPSRNSAVPGDLFCRPRQLP